MPDSFRRALTGIHAATIVPMREDFSIDEDALAEHISWISNSPGIQGLLINGRAGENFVLDRAEKRRVVEIARAASPRGCLIVSGVNAESSLEAAKEAGELAPDELTMANLSVKLGARGSVRFETLTLIPVDDLLSTIEGE